jgi:dTDP-4-dehydrorhamnose reductase
MDSAVRHAPLVLGAGGLLGRAVAAGLEAEYPGTIAATRVEADLTDRFRLEAEIERLRPGVVINCAAFSDPDACETDPERARRVNVEGAENVALACAASGCRLVHLSTALVFDGARREPYAETDPPAPLSVCGRTRAQGEARVAAHLADHLIVRAYWVFGPGRPNFVDAVRRRAGEERVLRVSGDEVASPTSAADCAVAVARLLRTGRRGVVHFANRGSCSRVDLAREVLRLAGDDPERVRPVPAAEAGRLAPRPPYAALDTALYARLTGAAPRPWRDALAAYLKQEGGADGAPPAAPGGGGGAW